VQASLHASLPPPPPPSHFYVAESCAPTCAEPNRDPGGLGAPVGLTVPLAAHCPWSLLLRCSPLHFLHPSSLPSPHVRPSSTRSQARVECRSRFTSREGYMSPPGVADRVQILQVACCEEACARTVVSWRSVWGARQDVVTREPSPLNPADVAESLRGRAKRWSAMQSV